jgi:hypothetical protein
VLGTKHTAANRLSQRPCTKLDNINKANEVDINNFINTKLNAFSVALAIVKDPDLLTDRYSKDS